MSEAGWPDLGSGEHAGSQDAGNGVQVREDGGMAPGRAGRA